MADYNSSYTGQQIDEGVGVALTVPSTYRTAAAQDVIDAGLVSAVAAQSFSVAQQQQARANIGAASEWELLWENASPTSNFAAQTLALDLSSYDAIIVSIRRSGSSAINGTGIIFKDGGQYAVACFYNASGQPPVYRAFACSNSGVTITTGFTGTGSTAYENLGIPEEIYGIKGVQTS